MRYRADINGLRAIAVLSVVANHVEVAFFPGGFLGVDVFFVISGYLISGIIFSEIQAGKFSILTFYERRIRRIFPALAATFLATLPLVYIYFLPVEVENFAKSLFAATFCFSNMYFWSKSGYFDALATEKPLLHTWSLGVEEQFYIFFPAILIWAQRYIPKKRNALVIALFLLSFIANISYVLRDPDTAFYLAPTRAWELLLGALISLGIAPEIRGETQRNIASLIGLILIMVSIVLFSRHTLHIGIMTMLPCIGTALVIAAGNTGKSWGGSILSVKPMVFIGLISYSLYLWHWPIIVFHRMGFISTLGFHPKLEKAIIIGISLAVATVSWKYIETPFRNKQISRRFLFRFAFIGSALFALISLGLITSGGMAYRFPEKATQVSSFLDYDFKKISRFGTCFISAKDSYSDFDAEQCLHEDKTKKNYLLIGDSHAAHLWYGLSNVFPDINVMQATVTGCKPSLAEHSSETSAVCSQMLDSLHNNFIPNHKLDAILIHAYWFEDDLRYLSSTLDYAKQHASSVILFGPMVRYDTALPRLMAASILQNDPAFPFQHVQDIRAIDAHMAKMAEEKGVRYVSFLNMLCTPDSCQTFSENGTPMLYDYGHLTAEGSIEVAKHILEQGSLP